MLASLLVSLLAAAPVLDDAPLPQTPAPNDAALIVGISDYAFISDVPYADRDARAFASWLTRGRGLPADRVRLLLDSRAVKESIEQGAKELAQQVGADGTLWIFFAGHGVPGTSGPDGLLAGADAQQTLGSLQARSVSRNALVQQLSATKAGRVVVLIDACFSGKTRLGDSVVEGLRPLVPVSRASSANRVLVFSAASEDETSGPFDRTKQGLFSYFAIGGLRGWADLNADGNVTASELATYTRRGIASVLSDGSRRQTPNVNLDVGDERLEWQLASAVKEKGPELTELLLGDTALASAKVEGVTLAAVPELSSRLKPGGAIEFHVEPDVIVAYDAAVAADRQGEELPLVAAQKWEVVYALEKGNPYRADAIARARQWREFAERKSKLDSQRGQDEERIRKILPIASVPPEQKKELLASFTKLYGTAAASVLVASLPSGADRSALCDSIPHDDSLASVSVWMPFRGNELERGVVQVDGREIGEAPAIFKVPSCASKLEVLDRAGEKWSAPLTLAAGGSLEVRPSFTWSTKEKSIEQLQKERAALRAEHHNRFSLGRMGAIGGLALTGAATLLHLISVNAINDVQTGRLATGDAIKGAADTAATTSALRNVAAVLGVGGIVVGVPLMLTSTDPGELPDPTPRSYAPR